MVICYKCGRNSKNDRNTVFFDIPSATNNLEWHKAFLGFLGLESLDGSQRKICDRHFRTEDLEMKEGNLCLKENVLPLTEEFFDVKPDIKPERVYHSSNVELAEDESYESQELAPLEPLVEYVYDDDSSPMMKKEDTVETCEIQEKDETGIQNVTESNEPEIHREEITILNNAVEPMMPFFLSSPIFTVLNDNCEEETIILQIENQDEIEDKIIPYKSRILDEGAVSRLENVLCHAGQDITEKFTCEVCHRSYGCLNCLKSHYKTMHISTMQIMRYKCQKNPNVSKYFFCNVCELCFDDRQSTLNHYITHTLVCSHCGSGFDRQSSLVEHMKSVHNNWDHDTSFECVLCTLVYQQPVNLSKHYRLYHKMILCHICKSRFASLGELQIHEKEHWPKINVLPFACSKCNKAFSDTSEIPIHIRQEHCRTQEKEAETNNCGNIYVIKNGEVGAAVKPRKKRAKLK